MTSREVIEEVSVQVLVSLKRRVAWYIGTLQEGARPERQNDSLVMNHRNPQLVPSTTGFRCDTDAAIYGIDGV